MEFLGKFSLLCSSIPFVEIPFIVVKHAYFSAMIFLTLPGNKVIGRV